MIQQAIMRDRVMQLLIRWVFVVLPTVVIGYITLRFINFSYTAFTEGIPVQTLYFAAGLLRDVARLARHGLGKIRLGSFGTRDEGFEAIYSPGIRAKGHSQYDCQQ